VCELKGKRGEHIAKALLAWKERGSESREMAIKISRGTRDGVVNF